MITRYDRDRIFRQVFPRATSCDGTMTSAANGPGKAAELLVRDAELLVVDDRREIPGGWLAVSGGRVTEVGPAGSEPEAGRTVSAAEECHADRGGGARRQ